MKTTAWKRAARTFLQLVASGGLTAFVNEVAGGLTAEQASLVLAGWTVFTSFVQNFLEDTGLVPTVLKNEP